MFSGSATRQVAALVLGDVMLDRYLHGKVQRVSPEAPVPVVTLEGERRNAGGAGNVNSRAVEPLAPLPKEAD